MNEREQSRGRISSTRVVALALGAFAVWAFVLAMSAKGPEEQFDRAGNVTPSPSTPQPASGGTQPLSRSSHFFGVTTPSGPYNFVELDRFQAAAGRSPAALMFSQDWAQGPIRRDLLDSIAKRQMFPIVTWEPRDHTGGAAVEQPEYSLSRILAGDWDTYIRDWAVSVRDFGRPVGVRFAQQMNGDWFPWSEGVNGNQPGQYARAWRHIHSIFKEVRASNVIWIWSPNVTYIGSTPLAGLYPGHEYVDWVGIDGYNGGSELSWGGWTSPDRLFEPTIQEVRALTDKPLLLTEVASTEAGGNKAAWISDLVKTVVERHALSGFIWVESAREADWRIASSADSAKAFAAGIADRRFGPAPVP